MCEKLSTPITLISANGIFAVHKDTALLRIFRSNTFKSFTKSDTLVKVGSLAGQLIGGQLIGGQLIEFQLVN